MTNQNSELDELSAAELRERLITSQEENKALTDLFHTVIFELRSQLTVIAGATLLLLHQEQELFPPLDEKQTEVAEIAINGANRANEVIYELLEMVEKAKGFENLGPSLVQDYQRQLLEANQQLDKLKLKHDTTQHILQFAANEFMSSLSFILGYSQLLLKHPESMGGALNSEQLEGVEAIDRNAKKIHEAIKYYIFDSLRSIELVDEQPAPEAVTLSEIGKMSQISIESELDLETAVSSNEFEVRAIISLLTMDWYQRNKGNVLEVTAVSEDTLRFRFPHTTEIPSYRVEDFVDGETGRLKFTERQRYFNPVGLATGLVEKYGGAVYAELTGERTCHLSFALPVYREES